ncbi:MAG: hypothetical protein R3219_09455 [Hydrogenovibrio sp.]|nr:hypothetical protein [Hydrogenovibrio sp.]
MSHKHQVMIEKLFAHPMPGNLDWKKLSHTLEYYGAQIEVSPSNHAKIVFGENELVIGLPHHAHELSNKDDIVKLRHFLEENGIHP